MRSYRRAIVVGAGIAGLCAARALADRFERVTVFERDQLPAAVEPRPGVPQGRHAHALSHSSRSLLIYPVEGGRWIMSTGGRHDERPPQGWPAILDHLRGLRTPTAFETMRAAVDVSVPAHFLFRASEWRHYEKLACLPQGLLPIGDAICVFNPVYGQGMGVAAQEARLLQDLLATSGADPRAGDYFAGTQTLIDTPWTSAAVPDFAHPQTRGERPADLAQRLAFAGTLMRLAADDAAVHRLILEVAHLLKPRSAYLAPAPLARIQSLMAAPGTA